MLLRFVRMPLLLHHAQHGRPWLTGALQSVGEDPDTVGQAWAYAAATPGA